MMRSKRSRQKGRLEREFAATARGSRVRKVNGLLVDVSGEHRGTRQKAWIEIKSASSHDYICTGELKTTALSVSRNDGDWCTSPVLFRRPSLQLS